MTVKETFELQATVHYDILDGDATIVGVSFIVGDRTMWIPKRELPEAMLTQAEDAARDDQEQMARTTMENRWEDKRG
jgi:hypothetical protein